MTIVVRMDWHCDGMPEAEKGGFVSYDDYAALREAPMIAFGWLYAYCCNALDEGIDIRHVEVPEIHAAYKRDVLEKDVENDKEGWSDAYYNLDAS
jgi:hypothetical protein